MKLQALVSALLNRIRFGNSFNVPGHFRKVYEKNLFGGSESRSGPGSSLEQTRRLRSELPRLFEELGLTSLLDAPCGDCNWITQLDFTTIRYIGADVVPDLIETNRTRLAGRTMEFLVADLCKDPLPQADLIFCRDCLVHLPFPLIRACLANFRRSGATYLMTTTFPATEVNEELAHGAIWRPLNLEKPPFSLPPPARLLVEDCTEDQGRHKDKAMGVWRLRDLEYAAL